jgi:ribosomal protein S18 acetylase RimI-like enzyme
MAVALREAEPDDRETLRRLLADYLFEFDGRTGPYPYFGAYWSEPERLPLLIEADGELAGFCLIRVGNHCWSIAEFSVVPGQRRTGVGRAAVNIVVERASAAEAAYLEAKVHPDNGRALSFWLAAGFSVVDEPGVIITRRYL